MEQSLSWSVDKCSTTSTTNFSACYGTWKFTSSCHLSFLEPYESM